MRPVTDLIELLDSCEVDTQRERALLQGDLQAPGKMILVAGSQNARPMDLLKGLEIDLPFGEEMPLAPFPVECRYGEQLQFSVERKDGSTAVFFSPADLVRYLEDSGNEAAACSVAAPSPLLQRTSFRFLVIGADTEKRMELYAPDCSGFLLVMPAFAGAPGEALEKLCKWIKEALDLSERTGVVLNHTEGTFPNPMLSTFIARGLGVEKVSTWSCSYAVGREDALSPFSVLAAASDRFLGGDRPSNEALVSYCAGQVDERLKAKAEELEDLAQKKKDAALWLRKVRKSYFAAVGNAGAHLSCRLTDLQWEQLQEDVWKLAQKISDALPEMAEEVVQQRPDTCKEDLKNLIGDYVSSLFNNYMNSLLSKVSGELWQPAIEQKYAEALKEFRLLVQNAPAELGEVNGEREIELLKSIEMNLGDYVDAHAAATGSAAVFGLKLVVGKLMGLHWATALIWIALHDLVDLFGEQLSDWIAHWLEKITNPKRYAELLVTQCQRIILGSHEQTIPILGIQTQPAQPGIVNDMVTNLKTTILPLAEEDLKQQYGAVIGETCDALDRQADLLDTEEAHLQKKREELNEQRKALRDWRTIVSNAVEGEG